MRDVHTNAHTRAHARTRTSTLPPTLTHRYKDDSAAYKHAQEEELKRLQARQAAFEARFHVEEAWERKVCVCACVRARVCVRSCVVCACARTPVSRICVAYDLGFVTPKNVR